MEIEIQRGLPLLPEKASKPLLYPFRRMGVGESFDLPRDQGKTLASSDRRQVQVSRAALRFVTAHEPNWKFRVRCIDRETVRCQRIK